MPHYIYIVSCSDKTLYTGYTSNVAMRVKAHNTLPTGAKYTKARRPVKLVYSETFEDKKEAMRREHAIKKMSRAEKLAMIKAQKKHQNIKPR